ncbi:MAG: YaaR family protein [Firmicutes bacterium]|nr:YaaR family protein [Bacillota bacterium]
MKITSSKKSTLWSQSTVTPAKGKQSFSDSLDFAQQQQSKEQLRAMVDDIKVAGKRLKDKQTYANLQEYKKIIKEYLNFILKNYYIIVKERNITQTTLYTRIEIIDKEIEELTMQLLSEQKENFAIMAKIDHIEGLLLDIYF